MEIVYEKEGGEQRIKDLALAFCEKTQQTENMDAFFTFAISYSLSYCKREDVPYLMEASVAIILAECIENGVFTPIKTIKRGDVSMTYDSGTAFSMSRVLEPFVKLGVVK